MNNEQEQVVNEIKHLLKENCQAMQDATFLGWTPNDRIAQEQRLERILMLGKKLTETAKHV